MGDQNAHEGHRSRMLEIYLKNGIKGFSDVQALEFLLGYAIPRIDVNPLAHRLLEHFGSIHRVLDASCQELLHVEGMGPRSSALVTCVGELWKRGEQTRLMTEQTFRTIQSIGGYLTGMIGHYPEERAFLMCLDAKCRLLDFRELAGKTCDGITVTDDLTLVRYLYHRYRLKLLPGRAMGMQDPQHIVARVSFSMEIPELLDRLILLKKEAERLYDSE